MLLNRITIKNYKSLENLEMSFQYHVTTLVGANAVGKSNIVECLEFASDVYRLGLANAVKEHNGLRQFLTRKGDSLVDEFSMIIEAHLEGEDITHTFCLRMQEKITEDYVVMSEDIVVRGKKKIRIHLHSDAERIIRSGTIEGVSFDDAIEKFLDMKVPAKDLMITPLSSFVAVFERYVKMMGGLRLYQLDPEMAREEGEKSA